MIGLVMFLTLFICGAVLVQSELSRQRPGRRQRFGLSSIFALTTVAASLVSVSYGTAMITPNVVGPFFIIALCIGVILVASQLRDHRIRHGLMLMVSLLSLIGAILLCAAAPVVHHNLEVYDEISHELMKQQQANQAARSRAVPFGLPVKR